MHFINVRVFRENFIEILKSFSKSIQRVRIQRLLKKENKRKNFILIKCIKNVDEKLFANL